MLAIAATHRGAFDSSCFTTLGSTNNLTQRSFGLGRETGGLTLRSERCETFRRWIVTLFPGGHFSRV